MSKNYLIFPMKVMGITQTYDGTTSHYVSSHGTPADYPIDIAGADTGRSAFFCPCDEFKGQLADPTYHGLCHCRLYLKP